MLLARRAWTLCGAALIVLQTLTAVRAEENWARWRGPEGTGHSPCKNLPVEWDATSIAWKSQLPGTGQSAPMIFGDQIFLTAAEDGGRSRIVFCVDRTNGQLLWQHQAWTGEPESLHKMNSHATPSCVTNGERVVAFFGRGGLHCYDVNGKPLWSRDLGTFPGPWGVAASPVLVGDLVILNGDADQGAFIAAFDINTGKTAWQTKRDDKRGWSTPILIEHDGQPLLVVNGDTGVKAYDPQNGKELWFCKSFNGRGSPTVIPAGDLIVAVNGKPGDIYAVKLGGSGDVTGTKMAWHTKRSKGRDLPSPIAVGDLVFVVSMSGIATGYDAPSGKELWNGRLGGNFSSAPIAANGLIYIQNEAGETFVIRPNPEKLDIVAQNSLGDTGDQIFRASFAASEGQLFTRSDSVLYCIGQRSK